MKRDDWDYARYANFAFSFGFTLVISLLLGYFGGSFLDRKLHTSPFLMIAGILAAIILSFKTLLAEVAVLDKAQADAKKAKNKPSGEDREDPEKQ
ncbi:MAG: AtpZ/AtpI family protein [Firmicutes bacterium]|nr:AtpZ/AtpI family protein [Bacillota bacterium]